MTGCSLRDDDGQPLAWDRARRRRAPMRATAAICGRCWSASYAVRRPRARARLPADGRALSRRRATRRTRWRSAAACRPRRSGASPPSSAHVAFEQAIELPIAWTDWRGRRHETMVGRPVAMHAHARHLRPLQRLPHLPRAAPAADAARHRRCAGRLSLQVALPEADPARPGPPARTAARPNTPLAGMPLGFLAGPEDLLVDDDGRADPHRQGVLLGGAARRPRHDAHGDRATPARAIPTRSTRCSCTWPTWPGTRR